MAKKPATAATRGTARANRKPDAAPKAPSRWAFLKSLRSRETAKSALLGAGGGLLIAMAGAVLVALTGGLDQPPATYVATHQLPALYGSASPPAATQAEAPAAAAPSEAPAAPAPTVTPIVTKSDEPAVPAVPKEAVTVKAAPDVAKPDDKKSEPAPQVAARPEGAARTEEPAKPAAKPEPPAASAPAPAKPEAPPAPKAEIPSRIALAPVPDPSLVVRTDKGTLPIVAPDGRKPWNVYARPFDDDGEKPIVAILLAGLGWNQAATKAAIQQLPGQVTLSFAAYAPNLDKWIAEARAAGHEVMLQMPMEPINFPANDPGPHALLTSLTPAQNLERLEYLLGRFAGYIGVASFMGTRFTTSAEHMRPILAALNERGLLYLDSDAADGSVARTLGGEVGLPHAVNNRTIDRQASRAGIDTQLLDLERIARNQGSAIGVGFPYPVTIERLTQWTGTLRDRGFALAPISAAVKRQQSAKSQ